MPPRPQVISMDLYSAAPAPVHVAAYAQSASEHRDVAQQWMARSATLPADNSGAAVDKAADSAQRQAVAHQNEADALDASAAYHRRAADLGQQMNAQLDRLDQRAQRLIEGAPPAWHPRIRALAQAAGEALNSLYSTTLWGPQESAGAVIEPLHEGIIRGLGGPPAGGAAPAPVGKGLPPAPSSPRPLQAAPMPAQAVPDTATASAAAPAAASQPERPELVPVAVGVGVPVPADSGGGESANRKILPISPPGDDDDDDGGDGGGGTLAAVPAGGGAGGRAGSEKPRDSRGLGKLSDSAGLGQSGPDQHPPVPAAPSVASPGESTTPLAAAPAAADRRERRSRPQNGSSPIGKEPTP